MAILVALSTTLLLSGFPLFSDGDSPEQRVWKEDAAVTYALASALWRLNVEDAQGDSSPSRPYGFAADEADIALREFREVHRYRPGLNLDLYDETVEVLYLMRDAAQAMEECHYCEEPQRLLAEAMEASERMNEVWNTELA